MSAELRQMLRLAPLVLAQLDLDGRFVDLEGRLLGDLGLHPAEMIGRLATELFSDAPMIDGGGNPLQLGRILERVKSGERMTAIIQLSFRWLETVYSPVQSTGGQVSGMFSITTDVTERNLLRAERQRYFTMTRDLLCIAGMDGYFRMVNPSFERVLGYSSEELTSRKFLDFVHPDDLALTLAEIDKLRGGAMTLSFDNRYVAKDGEVHDLSWTSVADVVAGVLYATAQDVTETKKRRASLALDDRLAAVGSLAPLLPASRTRSTPPWPPSQRTSASPWLSCRQCRTWTWTKSARPCAKHKTARIA